MPRARDRGNARSRRVPTRATCAAQLPARGAGGHAPAARARRKQSAARAHAATPGPGNAVIAVLRTDSMLAATD